jgi:hypothetical protein
MGDPRATQEKSQRNFAAEGIATLCRGPRFGPVLIDIPAHSVETNFHSMELFFHTMELFFHTMELFFHTMELFFQGR